MRTQDAVVRALRLLEAAENERGWDRPPRIDLIFLDRDTSGQPVATTGAVLIPRALRDAVARPTDVLDIFVERFVELDRAPLARQHGVAGCAFMCEAWEVRPPPGLPAEVYERLEDAALRHELHAHPDRQEVRGAWAMDREGWFYEVRRPRSGIQSFTMVPADGHDLRVLGNIPDALCRFAEILK